MSVNTIVKWLSCLLCAVVANCGSGLENPDYNLLVTIHLLELRRMPAFSWVHAVQMVVQVEPKFQPSRYLNR